MWHQNATFYTVKVSVFQDSDGDGVGDIPGVRRRLEYLKGLGIDALWLQPFFGSPEEDDGYDVSDYYAVERQYGSLGDFVELIRDAEDHGIKIIVDMIANHTSDQHPWFQAALDDPSSPHRDFYVWTDDPDSAPTPAPMFPPVQEEVWTYEPSVGAYFLHHFYSHQPDLDLSNPAVREEMLKVVGFWLQLGVSGFRVDAAPYIVTKAGDWDAARGYDFLTQLRSFVDVFGTRSVLVGETNLPPDEYAEYFGSGDRLHQLYNFEANQHLFLSLARGSAMPLRGALERLPRPPATAGYINWLRNQDELDLDRLNEEDREAVFSAFAPDEGMRRFNGIRRRLAPMLGNDRRRIRLAYALMFTLPGVPMLSYGEEIGMGEDLDLPERSAVRTPMQWSPGRNAGFSEAAPHELINPLISGGEFGHERVNVHDQRRDEGSLLNWMTRTIRARKHATAIGTGTWRILDEVPPEVLALRFEGDGQTVVTVTNVGPEPAAIDLGALEAPDDAVELLADDDYEPLGSGGFQLNAHGYRWFAAGRGL